LPLQWNQKRPILRSRLQLQLVQQEFQGPAITPLLRRRAWESQDQYQGPAITHSPRPKAWEDLLLQDQVPQDLEPQDREQDQKVQHPQEVLEDLVHRVQNQHLVQDLNQDLVQQHRLEVLADLLDAQVAVQLVDAVEVLAVELPERSVKAGPEVSPRHVSQSAQSAKSLNKEVLRA
jgi:hypothetical protein